MQKFALILLLSAAAVACTEESPTPSAKTVQPEEPSTQPRAQISVLTCVASKSKLTVTCSEPQLGQGSSKGPVADIIYGGQNTYVKVTTSNVAYNSGTGRFTFDVTVKNLLQQPIGTTDGISPDPTGVRVFFASGPTVTGGSGLIAPVPDGFATFTAAAQAFYQYDGILVTNATSGAKTWMFIIAPTVDTFEFILFISSPVQYPDGYVEINGELPGYYFGDLHPGVTTALTGVVKNHLGVVIPGAVITWGTTDPNQITVDASGNATGVRFGTPFVTATSMGLNGSIQFSVTGTGRTWTGAVSTNWETGGNWAGGYTPALADTAIIPTGVPNFPALTAIVSIAGVNVADLATLSLGAFDMTLSSIAYTGQTAPGGVLGTTGVLALNGTSTLHGRFPLTKVVGTYNADGNTHMTGTLQIDSGLLQTDLFTIDIDP
jgi:hypothetical protein